MKKLLLILIVALMLPLAAGAHEIDMKTQYCFSYIKSLKRLYMAIRDDGIEATMEAHPPSEEGVSVERAKKIAEEIKKSQEDKESPQEWIEKKWNDCIGT